MVDDLQVGPLQGLDPSLGERPTKKQNNAEVEKNEFITLLVTQLQNQDPLDPVDNKEFAVDLAQFSQLEQLVSINDKLGGGESDISSLAGYLGHEVTLSSSSVKVDGGEAGKIEFNLERDASNVQVQLLSQDGTVVDAVDLGAMQAGKQRGPISGLAAPNGEYQVQVVAVSVGGATFQPEAYAAGTVSGFVPGPEPTLIVGNREVSPSEVKSVNVAS